MGLTDIGAARQRYQKYAGSTDPMPSRFTADGAYRAWAARADRSAAYLANLPANVRDLSAGISDAVLLMAWDVIDGARELGASEPVDVPGVGVVEAGDLRTAWGWLVEVVKSRHTFEWEAANDAEYATITAAAAKLQGVAADAVDWDAVPDELFDSKATALDHAVAALRAHVAGVSA